MVGSADTRQPAESRSQACRRACPAHDAGRGAPARPRLGPANSLSAVRVRGWRAVVKDVGIRPPNDGQAAADDARGVQRCGTGAWSAVLNTDFINASPRVE
jgi:hypothetical protein